MVPAIGYKSAAKIVYRGMINYMLPDSKYVDWRNATIEAAIDLYGTNSDKVKAVKKAWYAVGIGELN